ncbi:MAG: hypothetical protein ACHQUC_00155 [Chlamydiales bacterium]
MSFSFSSIGPAYLRFEESIVSLKASENVFISTVARIILTEFGMHLAALGIAGGLVYCALKNKFRAGELNKTLTLNIDEGLKNDAESSRLSSRSNYQAVTAFAIVACVETAIFLRQW